MSKHDDGGPAFPTTAKVDDQDFPGRTETVLQSGMSLRDWFAGQALAGLCAKHGAVLSPVERARDAYEAADGMLVVRRAKAGPD